MKTDEKRVLATSIYTTVILVVLLVTFLDKTLDNLLPINVQLITVTYDFVSISILDLLIALSVMFGLNYYFKKQGIKLLWYKNNGTNRFAYDRENTYKISKRAQWLRIGALLFLAIMFYVVIYVGVCATGECASLLK